MENYCAFSKDHTCLKWLDYIITRQELEEADALCHGNWIEIERKTQYIQTYKQSWMTTTSHIQQNLTDFKKGSGLTARPSRVTLLKDPKIRPSRRALKNYAIFYARPYRQTLKQIGKP